MAFFQDWKDQQIGSNRLLCQNSDSNFCEVYRVRDFRKHYQKSIIFIQIPFTVSVIIPFSSGMVTSAGIPTGEIPVMPATIIRSTQHKSVSNKYMLSLFILGLLIIVSGCSLFPFGASVQSTRTFSPAQAIAATATVAAQAYTTGTTGQGVMIGFDAAHTNNNSYEHTIGPGNISQLTYLWSFADGSGPSPVVASGMMIYVGSVNVNPTNGQSNDTLYAFDATCRKACQPLWSFATEGLASTPAVANRIIYVDSFDSGSSNDTLYAFDATCRKACQPLWSFVGTNEIHSPPIIAGGMIYIGSNEINIGSTNDQSNDKLYTHKLYAFDATCRKACHPLWSFVTGDEVFTPAVANGIVYVDFDSGSSNNTLYAFDTTCRKACQPLWSFAIPSGSDTPTVAGGVIYISSGVTLYAFDATCRKACQPLWSFVTGGGISTPAVGNGIVYIGSGPKDYKLYAFDATCRKACQPLWSFATGDEVSTPAIAGRIVYISSDGGQIYAFDATCRKGCQPLWGRDLGYSASTPAIANGVVYINGFNKLYAFGLETK